MAVAISGNQIDEQSEIYGDGVPGDCHGFFEASQ